MPQIEPQYKKLFDKMPVPRFIVTAEGDGKYMLRQVNELAAQYFDIPLNKDGQGINIRKCLDHDNAIHFEQSFEVCLDKKRPVTIQTLPLVPGNIRIYGFYITPIIGETGEVEFFDVIGQMDVTDQSILQRERDDAISLLTSIFDVSEVGIVVTDHNRHIVRVNESFIRTFGWERDELLNEDLSGLVTPDEREAVRDSYSTFIASGGRSSGEMKIIRKDGSIAAALFTTATMELSQGRRFQITTVMDITLRKQMEHSLRVAKDQADSSNRSKSLFLANMSHELRTPLNAIIGFSEMMIAETFGALGHEKYKEYLTDVHSSAEHLLGIINEVLDMSKIEAGRIELDEDKIDMKELIESVTRMLDSRAFGNDIVLESDMDEKPMIMFVDPRLIRQVFINIIGNALKFSKTGDAVHVIATITDEDELIVKVIDQGKGIPEDKIDQALEPFGQISESDEAEPKQGTGLGLPLAKAMMQLHGGSLDIISKEGEGTTVVLAFPHNRMIKANVETGLAGNA